MAEKVLKDQLRWAKKEAAEAEEQSKFFESQVGMPVLHFSIMPFRRLPHAQSHSCSRAAP